MTSSPLTLADLQREVVRTLAPVRHPRIGAALALSEEAAEVGKLVLERECYGASPEPGALAGELADVLVCVAELADAYQVDLSQAVSTKLADLAGRVPAWSVDLGPALAQARARMDGP